MVCKLITAVVYLNVEVDENCSQQQIDETLSEFLMDNAEFLEIEIIEQEVVDL